MKATKIVPVRAIEFHKWSRICDLSQISKRDGVFPTQLSSSLIWFPGYSNINWWLTNEGHAS